MSIDTDVLRSSALQYRCSRVPSINMSTMVDAEALLAEALRVLLPLAVADEPEWLPRAGAIARHRAYTAARLALDAYDEHPPVVANSRSVRVPTPLVQHLKAVAA